MNKGYKELFEGATQYESLSHREKKIYFYDQTSGTPNNQHSITIYDGQAFHILCKKDLYDSCFAPNKLAQEELEHKLLSRNSFLLNLKHVLLTLFWSVLFLLIFIFTFKFVSYGETFAQAEQILSVYKLIIVFYFIGHLLRIFIGKRYKSNRYKNIFNFIDDLQFKKDYLEYKKRTQSFYISSSNPYSKPLLKNILRIVLFTSFYLFLILFFIQGFNQLSTPIDGSLKNRLAFFNDTFLPSASETSYTFEDSSVVFNRELKHFDFYGDYLVSDNDYTLTTDVFDMDFNLRFNNSYIPNLDSYDIRDIIDQYMLIIAKFSYSDVTEIIIYDLDRSEITLQINSDNFPVPLAREIRSNNFAMADDIFYLSISYYFLDAPFEDKNEFFGVLEVDGTQMRLRDTGVHPIHEIEYLDGYLYYIFSQHDFGGYYTVGKTSIYSFDNDLYSLDIKFSYTSFVHAQNLIAYENKLYLSTHTLTNELISFDENFFFNSLGMGLSRTNFPSSQSIFLFGSDTNTFIEYDTEGKVINQGISCSECNESMKFYKRGQDLFAIGKSGLLYRFNTLEAPVKIYNNSHQIQDLFPEFNLEMDQLYQYIIIMMLTISSISYLILIKTLFDKYKDHEFFELNW